MTAEVGKYFKNSIALILVKKLSLYDVPVVQGIIAEKGLDVKLSGGNVIPSLDGSI